MKKYRRKRLYEEPTCRQGVMMEVTRKAVQSLSIMGRAFGKTALKIGRVWFDPPERRCR